MAEQHCNRTLDSLVNLVHYKRSSLLAFCVLQFVFSDVATLENLLVIRALIKASTILCYCEKAASKFGFLLSCSCIVFAVYGRYYQRLDIEDGIKWKQLSLLLSNSFGCEKLLCVSSRHCIFSECYCHRI